MVLVFEVEQDPCYVCIIFKEYAQPATIETNCKRNIHDNILLTVLFISK